MAEDANSLCGCKVLVVEGDYLVAIAVASLSKKRARAWWGRSAGRS
jgi:hypothetical protein